MPFIDLSRTESTVELIASERSSMFRSISRDLHVIALNWSTCYIITCKFMQTHAKSSNVEFFFTDSSKNSIDSNTSKESKNRLSSLPLSECVKKLDSVVKTRHLEKIQCVGIDQVLLKGKAFEPDCLPPMELAGILSYLVLE